MEDIQVTIPTGIIYRIFFAFAGLLFMSCLFNMPYDTEYKVSVVLMWGIIICLIPDITIGFYKAYDWLRTEKLRRS